jgi:hypothetical protein
MPGTDRENDLFYINKTLYVRGTHLKTVPQRTARNTGALIKCHRLFLPKY